MRFCVAVLIIMQCAVAIAGERERPTGHNCELSAPPENAGEDFEHGVVIRIYPRANDIGKKYTGCQTMWMPGEKKWSIISIVAIEAGFPVRIWVPSISGPIPASCRYRKGRLFKGDEKNCPDAKTLIAKSLAVGCGEKMKSAVAAGLRAQLPAGCMFE